MLENLDLILTALISILAAAGIAKAWITKMKKEFIEALDAGLKTADSFKNAKALDSPGGEKLTKEEVEGLLNNVGKFISEFVDVFQVIKDNLKKKKK